MGSSDTLLFPSVPAPGESLIGLVARAANDNLHPTVGPILAAAGYPHHAHFDLAVSRPERLPDLARVLGVDLAEVRARSHPEVETPHRSVRVDFFGAIVMSCDLDFRARRVAPLSLGEDAHHRAIWCHRLLPWCTETGGMIVQACPGCGARLGWSRAADATECDRHGCDLRAFHFEVAPAALRLAMDPVMDLLAPDPDRHGPALARLHPDLQAIGRGAAFELGWRLACAFGAPAGSTPRPQQAKLPVETHVATLEASAALLRNWPGCVESRLSGIGRTGDAAALDRTVRRLRSDFRPRRSWPELSEIMGRTLPAIFGRPVRSRGVVHAYAPNLVDGSAAIRLLGTTSKKFSRLHRSGSVAQVAVGGGERHAFATYDAADLQASGAAFRDRMRAVVAAARLGITANGLEQMICLGAVGEIVDERVRAVCPGRQVSSAGFDDFVSRIAAAASVADGFDLPAYTALISIGGRQKPYGPLLVAMRDGRLPFALIDGDGPLLGRVLLDERDAPGLVDLRFDEAAFPGFEFAAAMTRVDAIDVLNIDPPAMMQALGQELVGMSAGGKMLRRADVLALAAARIAGGEIRHRWMNGRRIVPAALKRGGILRLGATGWDRSAVECLMKGE